MLEYTNEVDEKVQASLDGGAQLNLSDLIKESWRLFKKTFLIYIGVFAIMFILGFIFVLVFGLSAAGFSAILLGFGGGISPFAIFVSILIALVGQVLIAPLNTGFIAISYFEDRYKSGEIGQLFHAYKDFKEVALAYVIFYFPLTAFQFLMEHFGLGDISSIVYVIVSIFFMFAIPLIVFKKYNFKNALKCSILLAKRNFLKLFGFFILLILFNLLGALLVFIGLLFTVPFSICFSYFVIKDVIIEEEESQVEIADVLIEDF